MATASELNERLYRMRKQMHGAGSPTPFSNEPIRFDDLERECACGAVFQTVVGTMGGRVVLGGARLCAACAEDRDQPVTVQRVSREPKILQLLEASGVNVNKHGGCTLENWEGVESNRPLVAANDFVRDVLTSSRTDRVRGLYLCGETGTGKTHLAAGILRALLLDERVDPARVVFDRAARLITEIQDTYGNGGTEKVLGKREAATVWVLDDLGAEKATEDVLRILTDLFSAREGRANVITSNYEPGRIGSRWDGSLGWQRLASRLGAENFAAVRVQGRDRRLGA